MKDSMVRLTLMDGQASVFLATTQGIVDEARRIHQMSPVCSAALGRTLSIGALMGWMLKGEDDSLSVTIAGGGPAGKITVVAKPEGIVKGSIGRADVELPLRRDGKLDVGGAVGFDGDITVIRDLGLKEPYVGKVALASGEIGEDFATYFTLSEQQPSLVAAGVLVNPDETIRAAGGMIIHALPGCGEDLIEQLELRSILYADLSRHLDFYSSLEGMADAFFEGLNPVLQGKGTPTWRCGCSRERLERILLNLGREELSALYREDGQAELCCHFCRTNYLFSGTDLQSLLSELGGIP